MNVDEIVNRFFWIFLSIVFLINLIGVGVDIELHYKLILLVLCMIGLEINTFKRTLLRITKRTGEGK